MARKTTMYLICILLVASMPQCIADTYSNDIIEVHTSPYYYAYNETMAEIVVRHPETGNPYTGNTDTISVYLRNPSGDMQINGSHPIRFIDGVYRKEIEIGGDVGTYIIWATVDVAGKRYCGANIFEVRWSPYTNISGAEFSLGNVLSLINYMGRNNSQEIISHISEIQENVAESETETEKAGLIDNMRDAAFTTIVTWVFILTLMLLIFVLGTWVYGRRKATKLALKVANAPSAIAAALTGRKKRRDDEY